MSNEEVYRFYVPRCSICSYPFSPPSMWLLSLECGHLYCNYCIQELDSNADRYKCVHEDSDYKACVSAEMVTGRVEEFARCSSEAELRELVGFFALGVNYRGLGCRDPTCPKQVDWCSCPYDHVTTGKLSATCKLFPACWREQWCPFRHELPPPPPPPVPISPHILKVQSRCALHTLLKNHCQALNTLLTTACQGQPSYSVHAYTRQPSSTARWVYRYNNAIIDFQPSDANRLEEGWKTRVKSCSLEDGSEVFLSKMIRVHPISPADVIPIARVGRLASQEPAGGIEFECTEDQFNAILAAYQAIEEYRSYEVILPANIYIQLVQNEGISFREDTVYGTSSALDVVFGYTLEPSEHFGFPEVMGQELPLSIDAQVVRALSEEIGLICHAGYAYGPVSGVSTLLTKLERYEDWLDVPEDPGLVQYLTRERGLLLQFGKLYGPKRTISRVKEEMNRVEEDLPPGISPSDIEELKEYFPNVEAYDDKIRGHREDIADLLHHLAGQKAKERFPTNLSYDTIQEIATKHGLTISGENLIGPKAKVGQALAELRAMRVAAIQVSSTAFTFHKPAEWYLNQTQDEFLIVQLSADSADYRTVQKAFAITQKSAIVRIEKVQNRRMYTNFAYKHEAFSRIEGRELEIMLLFHGTSDTDPMEIAKSDEGLDPRIGHGMWGTGSYYAQKASYSHSYCYKTPDGLAQMFLCEVMVGKYKEMRPQDLRKPPKREDKEGNYHSVKGKTAGSYIWITYEAGMSYPSFLITYQS